MHALAFSAICEFSKHRRLLYTKNTPCPSLVRYTGRANGTTSKRKSRNRTDAAKKSENAPEGLPGCGTKETEARRDTVSTSTNEKTRTILPRLSGLLKQFSLLRLLVAVVALSQSRAWWHTSDSRDQCIPLRFHRSQVAGGFPW